MRKVISVTTFGVRTQLFSGKFDPAQATQGHGENLRPPGGCRPPLQSFTATQASDSLFANRVETGRDPGSSEIPRMFAPASCAPEAGNCGNLCLRLPVRFGWHGASCKEVGAARIPTGRPVIRRSLARFCCEVLRQDDSGPWRLSEVWFWFKRQRVRTAR
jgi:hypothetical protein